MSRVDDSPEAVRERVRQALVGSVGGSSGSVAKGVRMDPDAVRSRLRQVADLRRLGQLLARGEPRSGTT